MKSCRQTWPCNPSSSSGQDSPLTSQIIRTTSSYLSGRVSIGSQRSQHSSRKNTTRSWRRTLSTSGDSRDTTSGDKDLQNSRDDEEGPILGSQLESSGNNVINDWGDSLRVNQQHQEPESRIFPKEVTPDLKSSLEAARVTNINGQDFIPIDELEALVSEDNVRLEISKCEPKLVEEIEEEIVRAVCFINSIDGSIQSKPLNASHNSMRRLFALLVLMGKADAIVDFIREGVTDSDLPFVKVGDGQLARKGGEQLTALNDWIPETVDNLLHHQTEVAVPFFAVSSQASHYSLDSNVVLPFVSPESDTHSGVVSGGNSIVRQVTIHRSHFRNTDQTDLRTEKPNTRHGAVAVKSLIGATNSKDFEHESTMLNSFSGQHDHIVSLLATYRHGNSYHFVFPWAEGNLRDFWQKNQEPEKLELPQKWMANQILGLTQGLEHIHKARYVDGEHISTRHGDLKPENILCFEDQSSQFSPAKLVIADVGLARFHRTAERQRRQTRCTPTYRPPEYDLQTSVSQKYDIWALGCVFLEFATWLVAGWDAVEHTFPTTRTRTVPRDIDSWKDDSFFEIYRDVHLGVKRAQTKASVIKWLHMLHRQPRCTPFVHDILRIIEKDMLIVNEQDRTNARDLVSVLEGLLAKGLSDPEYWNTQDRVSQAKRNPELTYPDTEVLTEEGETSQSEYFETRPVMSDMKNLRLVHCEPHDGSLAVLERLRMRIEQVVGHEIDWHPLPPVNRSQSLPYAKLIWEYGNKEMSIILNEDEVERYRSGLRHHSQGILPVVQSSNPSARTITTKEKLSSAWIFLRQITKRAFSKRTRKNSTQCRAETPPRVVPTDHSQKEAYLCIDKCWTSVAETNMSTISSIETMDDDEKFFCQARKVLTKAQGGWIQQFLSWRSYTRVSLSKFHFLFDNTDLVSIDSSAVSKANAHSICHGYDYTCQHTIDVDIHMRMIAEIILHGIRYPQLGRGARTVLSGIPKLEAPPGLKKTALSAGWGFHAGQGLCLKKIISWIGVILGFGVSIVPIWLCSISNIDLQNAFAPVSFLATLITIALALVAVTHNL